MIFFFVDFFYFLAAKVRMVVSHVSYYKSKPKYGSFYELIRFVAVYCLVEQIFDVACLVLYSFQILFVPFEQLS